MSSFSKEQPLIGQQNVWKATSLKSVIDEIIVDPRFVGMSKYLATVGFYWSREIPTACAGHGFIFFNPDFFDSIPKETRITVIAHEIWHLILRHLERGEGCDAMQHNIAADHVINLGLEKEGFTFEGTDPCKDKKHIDKSTEMVYNEIYDKTKKPTPEELKNHISKEQIEDLIQDVLDGEGMGKSLDDQAKKAEKEVKDAIASGCGEDSSNHGIWLEVNECKVPIIGATYSEIFKDYLTDPLSGGKRTFMRPNRRQHGIGSSNLVLPGRFAKRGHINRLTHLTYALDVSGSITNKQATQFHQSVKTIKELLNPSKLTVLFFDTRIVLEKTFNDKEPYTKIHVNAGGGTDLRGVYKRTKELGSEALVVFTDLCVTIPPKPEWETIWIIPDTGCSIPKNIYGDVYLIPKI